MAVGRLSPAGGWTQEELAEAADLHENCVSRLETGEQEADLFVIVRLAYVFDLTPSGLLDTLAGQVRNFVTLRLPAVRLL